VLNNKKGIAFVLVFVLIGFITAIIIALGIQVQNQAHIIKVRSNKEIAFLIAQAGLKAVYYEEQKTNWSWFTHKPNDAGDDYELPDTAPDPTIVLDLALPLDLPLIDGALPDGSYADGASGNYRDDIMGGYFEVTAKQDLDDDEIITIESTGTYGSQSIALTAVYERALFNEYFIFTLGSTSAGSYNWTLDAGTLGKIYVGGDFWMSSHAGCNGILNVNGSMTVMGKIAEWSFDDTDASATIEYYLDALNWTQKRVRRFYLGLDDTPYGDPGGPYPPPGFLSGTIKINEVPLRSPLIPLPPISGACSNVSSYASPTGWLNNVSPSLAGDGETYAHILGYDDGADPDDHNPSNDVQILPIIGVLRANKINDPAQRLLDKKLAWDQFMADYSTAGYNNIFVNWAGQPPETKPLPVTTLPDYDVLVDSACIHIVDPLTDPGDDPKIVSALGDIPGCVEIMIDSFYDPAYCYQEDNWLGYSQDIRDAYIAAYPAINTTDPGWRSHHDGSQVGLPIKRVVVIDVGLMVDDTQMVTPSIPDRSVIHSEVPVILLGTSNVAKTFTFICDDNLYLQGDFNNIDSKSITLMSRTQGFYQSDTFLETKTPFVINNYYTAPAKGAELQTIVTKPFFKVVSPRASTSPIVHSDSIPVAVSTTQNALFIGSWGNTREDWCTGSVPLIRNGAFITLDKNQMGTLRISVRKASNEYDIPDYKLYSGGSTNYTQSYCDAFYDNPAAGQIAGRQLLEWRID